MREPLLRTRELASAAKRTIKRGPVQAGLEAAGLRATDALVEGLLAEAHDHAIRVAQEGEQLGRLHHLDLPLFQLPVNPEGVDASTVREFADLLTERGWPGTGPAAR